jgi:hypothetical protein
MQIQVSLSGGECKKKSDSLCVNILGCEPKHQPAY